MISLIVHCCEHIHARQSTMKRKSVVVLKTIDVYMNRSPSRFVQISVSLSLLLLVVYFFLLFLVQIYLPSSLTVYRFSNMEHVLLGIPYIGLFVNSWKVRCSINRRNGRLGALGCSNTMTKIKMNQCTNPFMNLYDFVRHRQTRTLLSGGICDSSRFAVMMNVFHNTRLESWIYGFSRIENDVHIKVFKIWKRDKWANPTHDKEL